MRAIVLILACCAMNIAPTGGFRQWNNCCSGRSSISRVKTAQETAVLIEAPPVHQTQWPVRQGPKPSPGDILTGGTTMTAPSISSWLQQSLSRRISTAPTVRPETKQNSGSTSQSVLSLRGGSHLNLFPICPGVGCGSSIVVNAYSYAMENHYLVTQAITMAIFSGIGDYVAQSLERRQQTTIQPEDNHTTKNTAPAIAHQSIGGHDWKRTMRFMIKGIGCGVIWARWYEINEWWSTGIARAAVSSFSPSSQSVRRTQTIVYTLFSILLEQFIASPLIFGLWDIPLLSFLYGTPIAKIPAAVRKTLIPLLIANAKLWTMVNVLIYNVPLKWRVGALSCAELVWQAILSSIAVATTTSDESDENVSRPPINAAKK
jgi:Mpv17 / PMP22 family